MSRGAWRGGTRWRLEAGRTGVGVKRQRGGAGIRKGWFKFLWGAACTATPYPQPQSSPLSQELGQRSSNPSLGKKIHFSSFRDFLRDLVWGGHCSFRVISPMPRCMGREVHQRRGSKFWGAPEPLKKEACLGAAWLKAADFGF